MSEFHQQQAIRSSSDVPHTDHLGGQSMAFQSAGLTRKFRGDKRKVFQNIEVAELCGSVLREAYGDERKPHRAIAEDTGMSPRAAENWISGENPMSLVAFLNAYHNNQAFRAYARKLLLMEQELNPEFQTELARFITAVQRHAP